VALYTYAIGIKFGRLVIFPFPNRLSSSSVQHSRTADHCANVWFLLLNARAIALNSHLVVVPVSSVTNCRRAMTEGWLGSRVVSVLDSGAVGPGFKSQRRRCRVTVLAKLFTPIVPLFTKQRNWWVTAGLAESNGSSPPGLWLTSPAGWLPRTWIISGTLRSVIDYRLPLPFTYQWPHTDN